MGVDRAVLGRCVEDLIMGLFYGDKVFASWLVGLMNWLTRIAKDLPISRISKYSL